MDMLTSYNTPIKFDTGDGELKRPSRVSEIYSDTLERFPRRGDWRQADVMLHVCNIIKQMENTLTVRNTDLYYYTLEYIYSCKYYRV